jgi:hypothetical protein
MKEMYLKVEVEHSDYGDAVDVFFYKGRHFSCLEDDPQLVEIEDAENKGAEKFAESLKYIIGKIKDHTYDEVGKAFPKCDTLGDILTKFIPREINDRVEKIKKPKHVPTQGDVYRSRCTNNTVVVLSFNEKTRETRYVAHNYSSCEKEDYLNEHYYFTGENIDVSALVNKIGLN